MVASPPASAASRETPSNLVTCSPFALSSLWDAVKSCCLQRTRETDLATERKKRDHSTCSNAGAVPVVAADGHGDGVSEAAKLAQKARAEEGVDVKDESVIAVEAEVDARIVGDTAPTVASALGGNPPTFAHGETTASPQARTTEQAPVPGTRHPSSFRCSSTCPSTTTATATANGRVAPAAAFPALMGSPSSKGSPSGASPLPSPSVALALSEVEVGSGCSSPAFLGATSPAFGEVLSHRDSPHARYVLRQLADHLEEFYRSEGSPRSFVPPYALARGLLGGAEQLPGDSNFLSPVNLGELASPTRRSLSRRLSLGSMASMLSEQCQRQVSASALDDAQSSSCSDSAFEEDDEEKMDMAFELPAWLQPDVASGESDGEGGSGFSDVSRQEGSVASSA
eukprot:TRINITY_DN5103_c0_g1_i2.p1 TRINITY_DN5103_c0_g1~~TRINITY_DN5103_c0_g1_i2.p1  ORF type:complete len:398 (+),score=52.21 TRINITY_DN5103_c0_g1_i2:144-1337(+)